MKLIFLGVGEACDENYPNTSVLINAGDTSKKAGSVLLDCGFSVPFQYFSLDVDPNDLDGIWISHFHGDHYFGLPLLLLRLWEMGREKPLTIIGQNGLQDMVERIMDLAYPSLFKKLNYPLQYISLTPEQKKVDMLGFTWQVALSDHPQHNQALVIGRNAKKIYYSGDGRPTDSCRMLARKCTFLIHESFWLDKYQAGHCSAEACIDLAREAQALYLALVHLQRNERKRAQAYLQRRSRQNEDLQILIPDTGEIWEA